MPKLPKEPVSVGASRSARLRVVWLAVAAMSVWYWCLLWETRGEAKRAGLQPPGRDPDISSHSRARALPMLIKLANEPVAYAHGLRKSMPPGLRPGVLQYPNLPNLLSQLTL